MGSTLSTTVGYGFTLPYLGDDADVEVEQWPAAVREIVERYQGDEYEALEEILEGHPGFVFDVPYYHDHSGEPVIFLESTSREFYGIGPQGFDPPTILPNAEQKVAELAKELGGSEPGWFIVTSYG